MDTFRSVASCTLALVAAASSPGGEVRDRDPIDKFLEACMGRIRERRGTPPLLIVMERAFGAEEVIPFLEAHLRDPCEPLREALRYWLSQTGLRSRRPAVRRRVVDTLLAELEHERVAWGLAGRRTAEELRRFSRDDFSERAKAILVKRLAGKPEHAGISQTILLVGLADIKSQIPVLEAFLSDDRRYRGSRFTAGPPDWAARKARARMGVKEDIRRCIEIVESEPDPHERIEDGLLDLTYVRRPEVVEYLRGYLESKESFVPIGADELVQERGPIKYAAFAARALQEMIPDFPRWKGGLKDDPGWFDPCLMTAQEIATCRRRMAGREEYGIAGLDVPEPAVPGGGVPLVGTPDDADREAIKRLLRAYLDVRKDFMNNTIAGEFDPPVLARAFGADLLPYLARYCTDESRSVRSFTYKYLAAVGLASETPDVRREVVERLAEAMGDETAHFTAYDGLIRFTIDDFPDAARMRIIDLLEQRPEDRAYLARLALVVGVADIPSQLPALKGILDVEREPRGSEKWWDSPGWAAMRARARMGVEDDIRRCIELAEAEPNVELRLRDRFRDLSYVRRWQVVAYLRTYLDSDEALHRWGSRYAAYHLARMIRGFPVKKAHSYSDEDIATCRKWMAAYDLVR